MDGSDLSFFTSQELIDELTRRSTFLGIVVHSEQEMRNDWAGERVFKVRFNHNLDTTEASRLLERVAEHMNLYPS